MNLAVLVQKLSDAKRAEELAKATRVAIEEEIAVLIPTKEVGQRTEILPDRVKVTVKRALSYKADLNAIRTLFAKLQEVSETATLFVPIKRSTTEALDVKGYEWFKKHDLYVFNKLVEHVTVTPKKVSITIQQPKE